jgi:hypothetical protein
MNPLAGFAASLTRKFGFRALVGRKPQRGHRSGKIANRHVNDESRRLGVAFALTSPSRRRMSIWLIPVCVLGAVVAALAIAHIRVELIQQGYQRANNVKRHQQLEEEQRNLVARVRELRDPTRLAALAEQAGLSRPERIISLALLDPKSRP